MGLGKTFDALMAMEGFFSLVLIFHLFVYF